MARQVSVPEAPSHAPPDAPDKQTSLLGTDASASPHRLRLVLVSTAPGRTLADSTAAIGTDPRNPQVYAGGAVLSNGARIVDIRSGRVTLSLRGRNTSLQVEEEAATRAAQTSGWDRRAEAALIDSGDPASVGAADDASSQLAREPSSREDLSAFLRLQPVFDGDRVSGLMVFAGTDASRLSSLGLEAGDIIRVVGGVPIGSQAASQEIDDVLSAGDSLVVEIDRKGSRLSVFMDGARLGDDGKTIDHP